MATLHIKPKEAISAKAIPSAIAHAIAIIFKNCGEGVWLVGGTAIAGYYAEHRRSDDIDLFVKNIPAFQSVLTALKTLEKTGAHFSNTLHTPLYFHADAEYKKHRFTIDIVLDENLFASGSALRTKDGVEIADVATLFAMKCACLVSRCSEKDLFDLLWFFEKRGIPTADDIITAGKKIDAGMTTESVLTSLKGAILREEACSFFLKNSFVTTKHIHRQIEDLRKKLIVLFTKHEKNMALPQDLNNLKKTVRALN